jgi:hypothetical protein
LPVASSLATSSAKWRPCRLPGNPAENLGFSWPSHQRRAVRP